MSWKMKEKPIKKIPIMSAKSVIATTKKRVKTAALAKKNTQKSKKDNQ